MTRRTDNTAALRASPGAGTDPRVTPRGAEANKPPARVLKWKLKRVDGVDREGREAKGGGRGEDATGVTSMLRVTGDG